VRDRDDGTLIENGQVDNKIISISDGSVASSASSVSAEPGSLGVGVGRRRASSPLPDERPAQRRETRPQPSAVTRLIRKVTGM
jgi:hypothetical protein